MTWYELDIENDFRPRSALDFWPDAIGTVVKDHGVTLVVVDTCALFPASRVLVQDHLGHIYSRDAKALMELAKNDGA